MRRSPLHPGKGFGRRRERLSPASKKRQERGNFGGLSRDPAKRMKKVGNNSHSKDWRREWRTLKREFERDGLTYCERCGSRERLTPAHTLKRRHITTRPQMREVVILCVECHEFYELMGEEKMSKALRKIIALRPERRLEAA